MAKKKTKNAERKSRQRRQSAAVQNRLNPKKSFRKREGRGRLWTIVVVILICVFIVVAFLVKIIVEKVEIANNFPDRGIPRLNIKLNGVKLEEIDEGDKSTKYPDNSISLYDAGDVREIVDVEIKGRGNMTWQQEKKPYNLEFNNKVELLGMGKARDWVLLANALDATNIRTDIAFYLERMLDMQYSFDGRFVELYVDGDYRGLYYLTHAIEISKHSVNLRNSLGVLVELDNIYGRGELVYYETGNGDVLTIKDTVAKGMAEAAMDGFLEQYNKFEKAVSEKDYDRICELVDVESFAQYYLLSEFTINPDAYWTSFYMYKDGVEDKIHAGPGWDFDLALSNKIWGNWMGEDYFLPNKTMARKGEIMTKEMYEEMGLVEDDGIDWYENSLSLSHIIFDLMEIPEFQKVVKYVYAESMKGRKEELMRKIEWTMEAIADAGKANEAKWGNNGFLQEVDKMKTWVDKRYDYFEIVYDNTNELISY